MPGLSNRINVKHLTHHIRRSIYCVLSLAGLAIPALTTAQVAAEPLGLSEAARAAYTRDPDFEALRQRRREAQALQREAASLTPAAPSLAGRYESDRLNADTGVREYEVFFNIPIWRPGQRSARGAWAEAFNRDVDTAQSALRLQVAGLLREAVWEAALRRNEAALTAHAWHSADTLARDIERRVELGERARGDALKAREESLRLRSADIAAQAEYRHALHRYRNLTGLERLPLRAEETQSPLRAVADTHPLLAHQLSRTEEARRALGVARRERTDNPSLTLSARQEQAVHGLDPVDSLGLSFTLPLGLGVHGKSKVGAANTRLAEAEADLTRLRRRLDLDLEAAEHELHTVRERHRLAGERRALAEENLRQSKLAFELGEIDITELLLSQTRFFNARRDAQGLRIAVSRAISRYNQAAGVLP